MFAGMGTGRRLDRCRGSSKVRCLNCQTQPWPGRCLVLVSTTNGENRGSSPLGSANKINFLYRMGQLPLFPSPIFLQINSGTRGISLLHVLVPPISYEE